MPSHDIAALLKEYRAAPEEFLAAHPNPWIVWQPPLDIFGGAGEPLLQTTTHLRGLSPKDDLADAVAVEVVKVPGRNSFPGGVTMGRSSSNDVQLDNEKVSRLHAWLVQRKDGGWTIADAESQNGTLVAGAQLAPGKAVNLAEKAELDLGGLHVTYYSAAALAEYLKGWR